MASCIAYTHKKPDQIASMNFNAIKFRPHKQFILFLYLFLLLLLLLMFREFFNEGIINYSIKIVMLTPEGFSLKFCIL